MSFLLNRTRPEEPSGSHASPSQGSAAAIRAGYRRQLLRALLPGAVKYLLVQKVERCLSYLFAEEVLHVRICLAPSDALAGYGAQSRASGAATVSAQTACKDHWGPTAANSTCDTYS